MENESVAVLRADVIGPAMIYGSAVFGAICFACAAWIRFLSPTYEADETNDFL
ncbi:MULTISPECIES: hypothetical protein [Aurantimonas]|uniref:hypothetical protein n=1 Tax=Aurantimonas TaxID=182269 RepID=UPI003514F35D